jgi:histidinol-phosphatase (PHP family)
VHEIIGTFDLNMVGSAVHFIGGEDVMTRCSAWGQMKISADEVYPEYLGRMESMLDYEDFDVLCHLDLFSSVFRY